MVSFNKFLVKNHLYIIGISIFVLMFFLKPIYGTTDDYILDSWLNGTYTGDYESYSIFISAYASNFFSFLYSLNGAIPWFPLIMLILNFISCAAIVFQIKSFKNISTNNYFVLLIILYSFLIWSYLKLTYTSTGIILAVAALVSLFFSIEQNSKKLLTVSAAFVLLSFSIRPESLIAAIIFFYPVFLFHFKNKKLLYEKTLLILSVMAIIFAINWIMESRQDKDFKEFRTWAKQVQSFAGRPTMEIIQKNIGNSGWTVFEYNSFKDFTYFDPNVFDSSWINSGLQITKNYYLQPNLSAKNIFTIFINIYKSFNYFVVFIIIILFLVQKNFNENKKISLLLLINFFIVNFILGLYFQNVARVSVPILVGLTIFFVMILVRPIQNKFLNSILFLVSILTLFYLYNLNLENLSKISRNTNNTNFIKNNFPQNIILIHGNQEFAQYTNPYSFNKKDQNPNVFMIGNWDTFSPHWYKRANNLGLDGKNLTKELLNNKKLLWTAPSVPDTTYNLKNFLREQGFGEVEAVRIDSLPDGNDIRTLSLKE